MKKIESFFLSACAYTVAIIAIFLLFTSATKFSAELTAGRFFIILLFGHIITAAGYILRNKAWHALIRYPLHYLILFLAFSVIFIVNGNIKSEGGSAIFSAAIIFTFFYALAFLIAFAVKKSTSSIEKKSSAKNKSQAPQSTKLQNGQKTKSYTPRFK